MKPFIICNRHRYPKTGERICERCGRPDTRSVKSAASPGAAPVHVSTAALPSPEQQLLQMFAATTVPQDSATPLTTTNALPAHSPLGASSAERWMNCRGSTDLIKAIRETNPTGEEEDEDWRANGVQAHEIAAYCLTTGKQPWQCVGKPEFNLLTPDMATSIQVYLDFVRGLDGEIHVEHKMHRPNLHPLFYGTLDASRHQPGYLHIIDYKNGAGVVVSAEDNVQMMYYAVGMLDELQMPDETLVEMTIVQPNAFHQEGPVRSWVCIAKQLRAWLHEELLPAMNGQDPSQFKLGPWCRFCPARAVCPLMRETAQTALREQALRFDQIEAMKMLIKAAEQEEYKRLMAGHPGTGGKLVQRIMRRAWKPGAEAVLKATYGKAAYTEPKLRTPKEIESLALGKALVSEWAYLPEGGLVVAPASDQRAEMRPRTATQLFGAAVQRVVDSATHEGV